MVGNCRQKRCDVGQGRTQISGVSLLIIRAGKSHIFLIKSLKTKAQLITRFSFCLVAILAVLMASSFLSQNARADHVIILQCTPGQLSFNEYIYKENINGINDAVTLYRGAHPNSSNADLAGYMTKLYVWMKIIPEYAHCMRDMGVDPSTIAQLSNQSAAVLIADADDLRGFSPDFLKEVPIPGFTNTAYFPSPPVPTTHEPPLLPNCQDKAFPSVNWSFCSFSGADLREEFLLGANLTGTDLSGANLNKAYAFDSSLKQANLSHSNASHTELEGSNLAGADLAGANLAYGSLDFASLAGADLRNADLSHTHGLFPVFYNATLLGANLSGSTFIRADFENADLSGANLTNADLTGADLNGTNLRNADLQNAVLTGANLHCISNPVCTR